MSNHISEAKGQQPVGDAAAVVQKKARQLVYDARYEVKGILGNKKVDPVSQERMVLQRIAKSTSSPAVKAMARQMVSKKRAAVKEEFVADIQETATDNVVKALFKVFVEGVEAPQVENSYLEELAASGEKKYKIRVTDTKTGNSYVRYATREKISQLRAQGLKVELTEYGEPREGEKKRGEDTARAKKATKLDPVGKEDGDVDNDGDKDKSDKYLMKRRKAIGGAIAMRKEELDPVGQEDGDVDNDGDKDKSDKYLMKRRKAIGKAIKTRKEDYVWTEAKTKEEKTNGTAGVDNYSTGAVKLFPQEEDGVKTPSVRLSINSSFEAEGPVLAEKALSKAQQRFFGMVRAKQKGEMDGASPEVTAAAKSMKAKDVKDFASTKHEGLPEKKKGKKKRKKVVKEESCGTGDSRGSYTARNLIKNKLRAMGAKDPMISLTPDDTSPEEAANMMTDDQIKSPTPADDKNFREKLRNKLREAVGGPVKMQPGSGLGGGVPAYPAGQEPKATGAKLPFEKAAKKEILKPLVAGYEPKGKVLGENEDKERKGTDNKGRDYGPGPKPTVRIPFEGASQSGWLERERLKKA